jgi:hypothetical protein
MLERSCRIKSKYKITTNYFVHCSFFMKKLLLSFGLLFTIFILSFGPAGCAYDNEEDLYGTVTCNTDTARYSVEVARLLEQNCYQCHLESSPEYSGYTLEGYDAVKLFASDGKLTERINSSSSPMPPSGLMSECDRALIDAWVAKGAPND